MIPISSRAITTATTVVLLALIAYPHATAVE